MDINRKTILHQSRDQKRKYSGIVLQKLLLNAGYLCSHPYCDSPYFSLNAHHIIFHSHGGPTIKSNGLILCERCHRLLHEGFIPRQLAYSIKYWIDSGRTVPFIIEGVSPDELVYKADSIAKKSNITVNDKFRELNNILIAANFLPDKTSMYFVFVNTIAAKVKTLNDGTYPLKSCLSDMLISMDHRRKWAQILAAHALKYAKEINDDWMALYFTHSRAVGFNARNKFNIAVTEFRKALNIIDNMQIPSQMRDEASNIKSRLIREMAVCRAKESANSFKAQSEILTSLDIANTIGEPHNIDDALVRCVEGYIYTNELSKAETFLVALHLNWERLDDHLKAIVMKMEAKLALARNMIEKAEEIINRGLEWSIQHKFHHQIYHFKRLEWHMKMEFDNPRDLFIT